ncbi:Serine/threonine-protein kinase EDR1 [Geodia barretti]|uniref:Serine/threonine-protein kinase EDR1 n=1 Tax=Geodia barretti TaxID=519541 RepID=A0AA35TC90_GEOBA|nr:Serine/threonine-protein kinase EDR1 [Geodia barretti]
MEGNTVQDIIRFMEDMAGIEYDIYHSAARRLAQQQVEEEWRKKNISFEPPALAIQEIPYQDLKIEKEIGNGGFGTVFACLWNEKPVAYKKFIQQQLMSRRAKRDFAKEMKILVSLDHPCIVRLFGAVLEERCLGIVMEYLSRTLYHALFNDESEFEDEKKKKIVSQLASALQYLHTPPTEISHCDIKSQNVLLDMDDNAKLSDFGLSLIKKNSEASRSSAAPIPARGTPRYSAPEVLRGELLTQQQFSKADIYSLAVCVFEIVTEEEAYYGLGEKQLEAQVGKGNLRPKAESEIAFSAELSAFLESCWDSTADNRPTSTQIVDQWSKITDLLA